MKKKGEYKMKRRRHCVNQSISKEVEIEKNYGIKISYCKVAVFKLITTNRNKKN